MVRCWAKGAGIAVALLVWLMASGVVRPSNWAPALPAAQASGMTSGASHVAGQSKLGGLDLNSYCMWQNYWGVRLDGKTINDWHCVDYQGNGSGLNVTSACQYQYSMINVIAKCDNFNDPYSWNCFTTASTGGSSTGRPIDWNISPSGLGHTTDVGTRIAYSCPPNGTAAGIWGTDIYTYDSKVCTAAVHAGLITLANGGTVTIEMVAGQSSYTGSTRNGVTSQGWSSWGGSYRFVP